MPVKVGAVAIGEQEPDSWYRKVEGNDGLHAVGRRGAGIGQAMEKSSGRDLESSRSNVVMFCRRTMGLR